MGKARYGELPIGDRTDAVRESARTLSVSNDRFVTGCCRPRFRSPDATARTAQRVARAVPGRGLACNGRGYFTGSVALISPQKISTLPSVDAVRTTTEYLPSSRVCKGTGAVLVKDQPRTGWRSVLTVSFIA